MSSLIALNGNICVPLLSNKPANSMEKRMAIQANKLAKDKFLTTMPIAKQRAAAVRLNKTRTSRNLRNSLTPSTKPTME